MKFSDRDSRPDSGGHEWLHLPSDSPEMEFSPSKTILVLALLIWLPWSGLGCIAATPHSDATLALPAESFAGVQSECLPEFPDHNGWYGGDAAYSVPLPIDEGRVSLWLFGDTFVQHPDTPSERTYPYVHNSIGISRCEPGGVWSLETFWQHDEGGTPRSFFVPDLQADWARAAIEETGSPPYYWLFDGFIAHDVLFIGLLRVAHSEPRGPFNLPFRPIGMDLARIENYRDAPIDWRIQISTLSNDTHAFPGSAFVTTGSHLYTFAFFDRGDGRTPRMLSRLELDELVHWKLDLSDSLETLTSDSRWKSGFEPSQAKIVMDDDASEMSIHFDSLRRTWIAVYSDLTSTGGIETTTAIQIRTASDLAGPWSNPEELILIPETAPGHARSRDENLFCYAAKAHPQFSSPGELVVTYVCNLFARNASESLTVLEMLRERVDLYRPRAIPVAIPSSLLPSTF